MRDYLKNVLGRDEYVDEFCLWAFGENNKSLCQGLDFMNAWNDLHGEELLLHEDSSVDEDILKMMSLWKEKVISDL